MYKWGCQIVVTWQSILVSPHSTCRGGIGAESSCPGAKPIQHTTNKMSGIQSTLISLYCCICFYKPFSNPQLPPKRQSRSEKGRCHIITCEPVQSIFSTLPGWGSSSASGGGAFVTVKLQEVKVGMFPSSSVGYCSFFCLRNGVCLEGLCLCTVGKTTLGFVDHCHWHTTLRATENVLRMHQMREEHDETELQRKNHYCK